MPQTSRTFRIFVSSTFSDLKAERNALQENVFPRLRDFISAHGCRFQAIDLRWGISEEASLDQQTMKICLEEIAHCQAITPRPNFIVLLGNRYGWCPLPIEIPASEFEQITDQIEDHGEKCVVESWYCRDENAIPPCYVLQARTGEFIDSLKWAGTERTIHDILEREAKKLNLSPDKLRKYNTSATEQEIMTGALGIHDASDHVFCFFRNISGLPVNPNPADFFSLLREKVTRKFPEGLDQPARNLLDELFNINARASVKDIAEFIEQRFQKNPKTRMEEEILKYVQQLFFNFTAYDFQNLDEESWLIDEDALKKQNDLKQRLRNDIPKNIFTYEADWKSEDINKDHITQLCDDVYNSLSQIILEEIEHPHEDEKIMERETHIQPGKELDEEGLSHYRFAEDCLKIFIGREDALQKIEDYLSIKRLHALAIIGAGGTGKSTLMAKAIHQTQILHPNAKIIYRFIGATLGSSDGRSLLESLCQEISRCYGVSLSDIPAEYRELAIDFGKRLQLATANQPLILFLDSLDQISLSQDARNLIWQPNELPDFVHVVISTRKDDIYKAVQIKKPTELELGGLTIGEGNDLFSLWLEGIHRTLQPAQRSEVMTKFEESNNNPLYLKLAFEEARLWPSGNGQPPEELEPGVLGIMEKNMINRLTRENGHGDVMVSHTLGFLAASRYGLAEDEIIDLLSRDVEVFSWFIKNSHFFPADLIRSANEYLNEHPSYLKSQADLFEKEDESTVLTWLNEFHLHPEIEKEFLRESLSKERGPRLPIVLWSRLYFDLSPYLNVKNVDDTPLLNFHHRELADVATKVYLIGSKEPDYHSNLAAYFRLKADPMGDRSWTGRSRRGLSELPYHQIKADRFDDMFETLTDFKFLEHKAAEVGVQDRKDENGNKVKFYSGVLQLQNDYELALKTMPGKKGSESEEESWPLIVTAVNSAAGLSVYCPVCKNAFPIKNEALDTVISCPQEGCNTRLKINRFVINGS